MLRRRFPGPVASRRSTNPLTRWTSSATSGFRAREKKPECSRVFASRSAPPVRAHHTLGFGFDAARIWAARSNAVLTRTAGRGGFANSTISAMRLSNDKACFVERRPSRPWRRCSPFTIAPAGERRPRAPLRRRGLCPVIPEDEMPTSSFSGVRAGAPMHGDREVVPAAHAQTDRGALDPHELRRDQRVDVVSGELGAVLEGHQQTASATWLGPEGA